MKKSLLTLVCAAIAVSGVASPKSDLKPYYDRYINGFKTKNVDSISAMLAPDFKSVDVARGQTKNRAETIQEMKTTLPRLNITKIGYNIKSVTPSGKGAVALVTVTVEISQAAQGKTMKMKIIEDSSDTWTKGSKGWLIKESKTLSQKMFVNGKPFNPGG